VSRFHKEGGADLVWNVGTAYFGAGKFGENGERVFDPEVFVETVKHVKMIEIKLSQGAKPAHGGMLPKEKITPLIAEARNLPYPVEHDCNSPPKHSAFTNPKEMCEFIGQLRELSGGKPIGIKLCIGQPEEFTGENLCIISH
jgi:glutamate synthase domain-containing protein 2